ncbi:hypothetical protein RYX36_002234 [Vicia faba]
MEAQLHIGISSSFHLSLRKSSTPSFTNSYTRNRSETTSSKGSVVMMKKDEENPMNMKSDDGDEECDEDWQQMMMSQIEDRRVEL